MFRLLSRCSPALSVCFVQKRRLKANLEDEFELNNLSQLSICQAQGVQTLYYIHTGVGG